MKFRRLKSCAGLAWLFIFPVFATVTVAGSAELTVITNSAQWLALTAEEASRDCSFRWEATITLVDRARNWIVLQDAAGALAVNLPLSGLELRSGQRILLEGSSAAPYLPGFPDYPNRPASRTILTDLEAPTNHGLWYASRLRGFLEPPATGEYTFWIASDNSSELWLSPGADPAHARSLARVPGGRLIFTQPREWNKYPSQRSEPVRLEAGRRYYLEAVHEQGTGDDNLSVAWQGPGLPQTVIQGRYLWPWVDAAATNEAGVSARGIRYEYWPDYFVGSIKQLTVRREPTAKLTLRQPKITVLGAGELPEPRRFQPDAPLSAADDFIWGEWEGAVTFAARDGEAIRLELAHGSRRVTAWILDAAKPVPDSWREGRIRLRGVCELGLSDADKMATVQVWVPSVEQVTRVASTEPDVERAGLFSICQLTPANPEVAWGQLLRVRGTVIRQAASDELLLQGRDSFQGLVSADAVNWQAVGMPVEIPVSNSIQAGLAVASYEPKVLATATFDGVAGLGNDLENADIFYFPIAPGQGSCKDSVFTVRGAGRGIRTDSDQLHFFFEPLAADGEIVARVKKFESPLPQGTAGVMMRESVRQNAVFASVVVSGSNQVSFQFRQRNSALAGGTWVGNHPLPCWLKLVRRHDSVRIQLAENQSVAPGQELEVSGRLAWDAGQPVLKGAWLEPAPPPEAAADGPEPPVVADAGAEPLDLSIRDLMRESKARSSPALRIRGVVTFYDRVRGRDCMVVQDDLAAVFVSSLPGRRNTRPVRVGQRVELEGSRLDAADGTTFVPFSLTILGADRLPVPVMHPGEYSFPRQGDGLWTQLEGVAQAVDATGALEVQTLQEKVKVRLPPAAAKQLKAFVDARVKICGVMTRSEDGGLELLVPSLAYLEARELPPEDPFQLPAIASAEAKAFQNGSSPPHRVKISGVVTCRRDDLIFVQDAAGGLQVRTVKTPAVAVGDAVETVGFPQAGAPAGVLVNGLVKKLRAGVLPQPATLRPDNKPEGLVVQLEATVLDQRFTPGDQILELQAGGRFLQAILSGSAGRLPTVPVGSVVQVTGVGWGAAMVPDADNAVLPVAAKLFLRSPQDVTLLQSPPWWTWKHTAGVGGSLMLVFTAALVWIRELRQRVAARTRELQSAMLRLNEETQTSATLAERERLAAEIHDGLQQGLTGIMLQLEGAATRLKDNPALVRPSLDVARNMALFCLSEVRHSVLNLQSPLVTEAGLAAALAQIVRQMGAQQELAAQMEVSGDVRPLPPAVEHHLFRMGQEFLNNALKHAQAQQIKVALEYSAAGVRLSVQDDGRGFEPAAALGAASGHLGLRSLRGRARKLGGQLEIISAPGQGTTARIFVPAAPAGDVTADASNNETAT
jgi:signal transduction histidine kinase